MKTKIYKLLSITLAIATVLSTLLCAIGTASADTVKTYYVASADDGGSSANDGLSAEKPLLSVNEAIVKANELGLTASDTLNIKVVGTTDTANWGTDIACDAGTIKVESNDLANISSLNTPSSVYQGVLGGRVEFDNIKIYGISGNPNRIVANGRNITYGSGVVMGNGTYGLFPVYQSKTVNNTLTFTIKNEFKSMIYLTHWNNNGITYKKDLNYIIDNPEASVTFKLASAYNTASANKIEGNLNFAVYDAAKIIFDHKGTKGTPYYNVVGALQVLTPADLNVDITNVATIGNNDAAPTGGVYHIKDATGVAHGVELTETAGKYKINVDLEVYNIKVNGDLATLDGNYLTLDPGIYTVEAVEKPTTTLTMYVKNGAMGGDGLEATPYGTVAEAINEAKSQGLGKIDTLNVKILDNITLGTLPDYTFSLNIESAQDKVTIAVGDTPVANGNTVYKNVKLDGAMLDLDGKNVTLESDVEYVGATIDMTDAKAIINAKLAMVDINTAGSAYLVINNAESTANINFAEIAYDTVKLNLKAAQSVNFAGNITAAETVEVAVKNGITVSGFDIDDVTATQKWYIDNTLGDCFDFTETAGQFAYTGTKTPELASLAKSYFANNNIITAPAGEYTLKLKEFSMKPLDKAYIIFTFDDANMPFTKEAAALFKEYGMPMSCAVPANKVKRCEELHRVLLDIQANGGEILSHGYNHSAITSESAKTKVESEFSKSWLHLTSLGFDVNGIIEVGNGGGEATADYEMVETVTRKYYKYSNAYGLSEQYKKKRTWFSYASDKVAFGKATINDAIQNKDWVVFAAHSFDEISYDDLKAVLEHIESNNDKVEVVTWKYLYETFGEYNGPQVPSQEAIESLETYVDNVSNPNVTHEYKNACDTDCNWCGATRTVPGHVYDDTNDTECNECGHTRTVEFTGLKQEGDQKYYYKDGIKQTDVTDLVWIEGVWYYIKEGRWASDVDTLHKINGKWFLVKNGIWNKTTGLVEYKGKTFYVVGGKWNSSVTDLKKVDGVWYYIQYGKWNNTIDTLHKINGKWFLIKGGIWKKTTGLVEYKSKTFYVVGGKWNSTVNTLYKKGSKFYAIKSGKLYTGKTIISYNGKKFYCNKGYAQLSFSGKVTINNKTYTIKAGKVV